MPSRRIRRLILIGQLVHVWLTVAADLWPADWPFPWT